jgi:hypothetical protein
LSTVTIDFLEPFDVLGNLSSKIPLDDILLELITDPIEIRFRKKIDLRSLLDTKGIKDSNRKRSSYSIKVHKSDISMLSVREINSGYSNHNKKEILELKIKRRINFLAVVYASDSRKSHELPPFGG